MQLLGVDMNLERYKGWVMEVQARQGQQQRGWQQEAGGGQGQGYSMQGQNQSQGQGQGGSGWGGSAGVQGGEAGVALERLKWFLGLPNSYYQTEWKGARWGRQDARDLGVGQGVPVTVESASGLPSQQKEQQQAQPPAR